MPHRDGRLHGAYEDKWDGFPDSRRRLVQGIHDRRLGNVVIATGSSPAVPHAWRQALGTDAVDTDPAALAR